MATDKIDRDFTEQREILHGVAISYPVVTFVEGNVEHPMQAVLDLPMAADRCRQDFWLLRAAGQEVANFDLRLAGPVDGADGFYGQDRFQARPVARWFQLCGVGADKYSTPDKATLAIIEFVMERPVNGRAAETGRGTMLLNSSEFLSLVRLERHEIISLFLEDLGGNRPLAPHRIQCDDAALDVEHIEQFRDRRDLVGFVADLALAKHQAVITGPCTDDVERPVEDTLFNNTAWLQHIDLSRLADDPRFAAATYRSALEAGIMEHVEFREPVPAIA
jgi:hypothetical protein